MQFYEILDNYMNELNLTIKELSDMTGLSQSVISRYRNGLRVPNINGEHLKKLVDGLNSKAVSTNNIDLTYDKILNSLTKALSAKSYNYELFSQNFNLIVTKLNLNISKIATALNYNQSFIYRVRSGERHPYNIDEFARQFADYIVSIYNDNFDLQALAALLSININKLKSQADISNAVYEFLTTKSSIDSNLDATSFLNNLDEFDLNSYIKSIKFDKLKVPTMPITLPKNKTYLGIKEMREAELDFFKKTALSNCKNDITMYGDMPMVDMADDIEFNKKWVFAIACAVKKGLRLNIIHNLDRPWSELMLGIEAWIPLYMTGQISPYYFEEKTANIFHHLNYVSGVAALTGECIDGAHNNGRYYLTTNKDELKYYAKRRDDMMKHAKPLMKIFTPDLDKEFHAYLNKYGITYSLENKEDFETINNTFKNIDIRIIKNNLIIIAKLNNPITYFVISHPVLCNAIKNYEAPVSE